MIKQKKIPLRICLGCREKKPKKDLIRIVRTPESEIELDPTGKKAGRGAYICSCEECFKKALKGKKIERNLQVPFSQELVAKITELLRKKESEI